MPESEIARLRCELEEQAQAAWQGLYGLGQVGRHQTITRKMERMGETFHALVEEVGTQEATRILIEIEQGIEEKSRTPLLHAQDHQQAPRGYQNGITSP